MPPANPAGCCSWRGVIPSFLTALLSRGLSCLYQLGRGYSSDGRIIADSEDLFRVSLDVFLEIRLQNLRKPNI